MLFDGGFGGVATSKSMKMSIKNNKLFIDVSTWNGKFDESARMQPSLTACGGDANAFNQMATAVSRAMNAIRINYNLGAERINVFASANLLYPGGEVLKFREEGGVRTLTR